MARIRSAREEDRAAVLGLWEAAGMLAYTPTAELDLANALRHQPDLLLVAEDEGGVVGTVTGTTDGRRGWIFRLAVAPGARRRGIGRALVAEVERRLAARGVPQVNLLVFAEERDAAAFWAARGYEQTEPVTLWSRRLDAAGPASEC